MKNVFNKVSYSIIFFGLIFLIMVLNACSIEHTHIWDDGEIYKQKNCLEDGLIVYTCTKCNETNTVIDKATGHKEVKDDKIDPTCISTGLTEGSHCSVCNEVINKQEIIQVIEHNYENYVCQNCDFHYYNEGLEFQLSEDGRSYIVKGGALNSNNIVIPLEYNDLPVTSISDNAFKNRNDIVSIFISNNVTKIGNSAFSGCTSLETVILSENISYIYVGVFSDCSSLKSINIPNGVENIYPNAFSGCTSLETINIPSGVTSIGNYAFSHCSSLKNIVLSEGLKRISKQMFDGCISLENVVIPSGVTEIEAYAFYDCKSLTNVNLPKDLKFLSTNAFAKCESITEVVIPDGIITIGQGAFKNCTSLESLTLPFLGQRSGSGSDKTLGYILGLSDSSNDAKYPKKLKNVVVTNENEIENNAFKGFNTLISVIYKQNITSIGDYAFSDCKNLEGFYMPEGLTKIGVEAFKGCISIKKIEIPKSILTIGGHAFYGCKSLEELTLPHVGTNNDGQLVSIYYCENSAEKLKKIIYTGTEVSKYFIHSYTVTFIDLQEGIKTIGDDSFCFCSVLSRIIIPSTVTSIGKRTFYRDNNLKTIYYTGTKEQWNMIENVDQIPEGVEVVFNYDRNSTFDVNVDCENVLVEGLEQINVSETNTYLVTPLDGYCITKVEVTGAQYIYCFDINQILISNPIGDVTIKLETKENDLIETSQQVITKLKFSSKYENRIEYDGIKQVWKEGNITLINNKGKNSSFIEDSHNPLKLNEHSELIIEGNQIRKIYFDVVNNVDYYASFITDIAAIPGVKIKANGQDIEVYFDEPVDSFVISSLFSLVKIHSITVIHE